MESVTEIIERLARYREEAMDGGREDENTCPECGAEMIPAEGCAFCPSCGWSPCK